MIAEVLTIGDELLRGEIVDSNKAHISERLLEAGIATRFQTSVLDEEADLRDAFLRAATRADVTLVSGGLGPTRDDITLPVLARTFERELVLHEPTLTAMRAFFARLGRPMSPSNEKQAWFPRGAEVLANPLGTAPGCMLEAAECVFFCMPGVPREMHRMLKAEVLPRIKKTRNKLAAGGDGDGGDGAGADGDGDAVAGAAVGGDGAGADDGDAAGAASPATITAGAGGAHSASAILRTFGMGESTLEDELTGLAEAPHLTLGFRTTWPDNFLRPVARGATPEEARARLDALCEQIAERLGPLLYARGATTMEAVVGALLRERGASLALAESCTGGLLGERVSAVPGCSAWFRGGVVAYANAAKRDVLGVPEEMLREHGAVSATVARAMAECARTRFDAEFALSTTGIAGPGGGGDDDGGKPVGTVFIGFAGAEGSEAQHFHFRFDRERHRQLTVQTALDGLRRRLLGVGAREQKERA